MGGCPGPAGRIEFMPMIKQLQLVVEEGAKGLTAAELFYSLAA